MVLRNLPMSKVEQKDGWDTVTIWSSIDPDENDWYKSMIPDGTIVWTCALDFWKDKPYVLVEIVSNHRTGWVAWRNVKPIDPPQQGSMIFSEELQMLCDDK